ncbi:hypothetical protein Pmani_000682 [Petrolisthes manimaculis]|uniref:Uncharacterized protein n=1 Tax=Petrolisthes manimaculis TaxID=1843537 RepID=A0AAE1QPL7_9EUCA|nr:hypothetical protein Pmani_000682 [Petrolisthes manimaculis]
MFTPLPAKMGAAQRLFWWAAPPPPTPSICKHTPSLACISHRQSPMQRPTRLTSTLPLIHPSPYTPLLNLIFFPSNTIHHLSSTPLSPPSTSKQSSFT